MIVGMLLGTMLWAVCNAEIIDRNRSYSGIQRHHRKRIAPPDSLIAFQNAEKPDYSPDHKREIAGKIVEQILIRRKLNRILS